MERTPLVSVIMPCYNHGHFIEAAIASVNEQQYPNVEIIVVDDGSTDAYTLEVLKRVSQKCTVIFQTNAGPSVARNVAVKASKGEYLLCLDSDNKVRPSYISKAVYILEQFADVGVVYGSAEYYGEANGIKQQLAFDIKIQVIHSTIDICSVFRRKVFDDVGGFDEYMSKKGLEDWDFFITVYERGWKLQHIPEVMFDYFVTNSSRTVQVANNNLSDLKRYVWQKHAVLLAQQYEELYHLNKNLPKSIEYKLGSVIMSPLKWLKSLIKRTPGK